jgi:hypothetical protein
MGHLVITPGHLPPPIHSRRGVGSVVIAILLTVKLPVTVYVEFVW